MSSNTRKALRDFYKLPSDTSNRSEDEIKAKSSTDDATEESTYEQEEEVVEHTGMQELDKEDVNVADFIHNLAVTESFDDFVKTADQIVHEKQVLASAQQELVNDNYKKLIRAAETLNSLSSQDDIPDVNTLEEPVERLTQWTKNLVD